MSVYKEILYYKNNSNRMENCTATGMPWCLVCDDVLGNCINTGVIFYDIASNGFVTDWFALKMTIRRCRSTIRVYAISVFFFLLAILYLFSTG